MYTYAFGFRRRGKEKGARRKGRRKKGEEVAKLLREEVESTCRVTGCICMLCAAVLCEAQNVINGALR